MPLSEPLPYCASLAKTLRGPTIALVLTYLEINHRAQQDPIQGNSSFLDAPITIDCDIVCDALGISRRTLHIAINCLGCCWGSEADRGRAARSGREFLNPNHSLKPQGHDPVKIYSFTGFRAYTLVHRILAMRRNHSKLADVLLRSGLLAQTPCREKDEICATRSTARTLPEILQRSLVAWGDRRAERWDRWRRETGKKSSNPGRMRDAKKLMRSSDADASD